MLDIFLTVAPVFIVLAAGYVAVRAGYLPVAIADQLNNFAVRLAVPALLFGAMVDLDLAAAFAPPMLAGFYGGAIAGFALAIMLARTVWKRRPGEAVAVGFAAMFSNTVLLGLPIVERAYGEHSLEAAFGIIAFHAPLLYAVGMVTMEFSRRDGRPLGETLASAGKSIAVNPLMIGILFGLAVNLSGLGLPEPVSAAVAMLSAAAIPAALVGIGAALTQYRLRADLGEALMVSAIALILHPAIAWTVTHLVFALPPEQVRAATVVAAMPPGMNIYIFAVMYDRATSLAASTLLVATALSVVSITLWLTLLDATLP